MTALARRSVFCGAPIRRDDRPGGDLLPSEESATLLLWAWPRHLGWPRAINWLFSPVVGNKAYPGDLWGLDSNGELLILETKLDRTGTGLDPLVDFVDHCSDPASEKRWQAGDLRRRWVKLVEAEESFLRTQLPELTPDNAPSGTHPGVLPYSNHRDATWRWQALYRERVAPRLLDGRYRRAVERALRVRAARRNPPPAFVGLIGAVRLQPPVLSKRGLAALRALQQRVGPHRVHLRTLRVTPHGPDRIRVDCFTFRAEAHRRS